MSTQTQGNPVINELLTVGSDFSTFIGNTTKGIATLGGTTLGIPNYLLAIALIVGLVLIK